MGENLQPEIFKSPPEGNKVLKEPIREGKKEIIEIGPEEVDEIWKNYSIEEWKLFAEGLRAFQLTTGCSEGCEFCAPKTRKGVTHKITLEGVKHLFEKEIEEGIKFSDLLKGSKSVLYSENDPLDNPEYVKILKLFKEAGAVTHFTATAYPKVENAKEMLIELLKVKKHKARISVKESNYERLINDGWLEIVESGDIKTLTPTVESLTHNNLDFVYRFKKPEIKSSTGELRMPFTAIIGGDGIYNWGRAKENSAGSESEKMKNYIDNQLVFSPGQGFSNILSFYDKAKEMSEAKGFFDKPFMKARIRKHFSDSKFLSSLLKGDFEEVTPRQILSVGVIDSDSFVKDTAFGTLYAEDFSFKIYIPRDALRKSQITSVENEDKIPLVVDCEFDKEGLNIMKVKMCLESSGDSVDLFVSKDAETEDEKFKRRRREYNFTLGQRILVGGEECVFDGFDDDLKPKSLSVKSGRSFYQFIYDLDKTERKKIIIKAV